MQESAHRFDFAIVPGIRLGWFRLGASIWDIIRLLRNHHSPTGFNEVELKYSDEHPFDADIIIRLPSNGIELRFEPKSQRLRLIKVFDFNKGIRLAHNGYELSSSKTLPTFIQASNVFGPTVLGDYDKDKRNYTSVYPGVALVFPIPEKCIVMYQTSTGNVEAPIEFPDKTTPVASQMYVFLGADWASASLLPLPTLLRNIQGQDPAGPGSYFGGKFGGDRKVELEWVMAKINYGATLHLVTATHQYECSIILHVTTPQDLLADLGAPGSIYYKEEDKMKIHSDTNTSPQSRDDDEIVGSMDDIGYSGASRPPRAAQQPNDYFYNYFNLGIDVQFDGSTHRCKKIVMHTNVPGHIDFQSYKKCPFVLHPATISSGSTGTDSEAARLPPIAPSRSTVPAGQSQPQQPSDNKTIKGRSRANAPITSEGSDGSPSPTGSGSSRGSPELQGMSPVEGDVPKEMAGQERRSGIPEREITPEMKISAILAILDPVESNNGTIGGGAMAPPRAMMPWGPATTSQNPFGRTTLHSVEGALFEAMKNEHIVNVILF